MASDVDLNLLRTFVTICEAGSLTRAAETLHMSQPAVSHALARLRRHIGDPLLVRSEGGMSPTALGLELLNLVRGPLALIADAFMEEGLRFDPLRSTRTFSLALTDFGASSILPRLLAQSSRVAPLVNFDVRPIEVGILANQLASGEVDAAVASTIIPGPVESEVVLRFEYGCLVHQDFPEQDGRISEEAFLSLPHASVPADTGHTQMNRVLASHGRAIRSQVVTRSFTSIPPLVAHRGLIAVVPGQNIAGLIEGLPLKVLKLPFDVPPTEVYLHWHPESMNSPARAWLLEVLREVLRSTESWPARRAR